MATVSKSPLRKALTTTELVDPQGLTPYVALHLGTLGKCYVRRTGAIGFVETVDSPDPTDPGWSYVSYAHLQDCLKYVESDEVDISTLPSGGVTLKSTNAAYETEMRIHTVDRSRAAFKHHTPGDVLSHIEPTWLRGLNTKAFTLASPPILIGPSLILTTTSGVVRWETTYDPELPSFPRESFLRAISGETEGSWISLTMNGYFVATQGDMTICTGGHQGLTVVGPLLGSAESSVVVPAGRFLQSLRFACGVAGPTSPIHLSSKLGVTARDSYGLLSRFSLGDTPIFATIALNPKTAKLIVDALEQAQGGEVSIQRIVGHTDKLRVTRSVCSVSFTSLTPRE